MIASWIIKRTIHSLWDTMSQDTFDVDSFGKGAADDMVWDSTSELGVGETLVGKKAISEWFHKWQKEIPKRKITVKNICMKGSFLPSPSNVVMVEWGCVETDKEGKELQFDGVTVIHIKNMKTIRASEYVSFKGLPKLSTLIKPAAGAQTEKR